MRWHIIRTLVHKEALRHLANRGGIALAALLLVMALLMAVYNRSSSVQSSAGLIRSVYHCYIDYWEEDALIDYLKLRVPPSLDRQIHFRHIPTELAGLGDATIKYPTGAGAIQLRPAPAPGAKPKIWCWYPGEDRSVMAPFENWFWRTHRAFLRLRLEHEGMILPPLEKDESWVWRESHQQFQDEVNQLKTTLSPEAAARIRIPDYSFERSPLTSKPVGTRTTIASALVLFALFFVCVYLLPSLTCEERERGVLLAQALSPASPLEILIAKLIFYPTVAVVFAGLLGGLPNPAVLTRPIFWLTLFVLAFGSLGIGMTIACVARSQRSASMSALCYMLVVSMILLICQQGGITVLPQFVLEYHGPRLLSAVITNSVEPWHYVELGIALGLAIIWNTVATISFRKYGWQ